MRIAWPMEGPGRSGLGIEEMADTQQFDVLIIGAGPGGYVGAIRAGQLGLRTACVEKMPTLGGTCLNIGCIPSKALLDSSEWFVQARTKFARHGIKVGDVALDLKAMLARKDAVVKGLTDGVAFLFKKNKITFVQGSARLGEPGKVVVKAAEGDALVLEA